MSSHLEETGDRETKIDHAPRLEVYCGTASRTVRVLLAALVTTDLKPVAETQDHSGRAQMGASSTRRRWRTVPDDDLRRRGSEGRSRGSG